MKIDVSLGLKIKLRTLETYQNYKLLCSKIRKMNEMETFHGQE